jgi:hypothetical protein
VRAYLPPDLSAAARADSNYQAQMVIGYVFDRLSKGWARLLVILNLNLCLRP